LATAAEFDNIPWPEKGIWPESPHAKIFGYDGLNEYNYDARRFVPDYPHSTTIDQHSERSHWRSSKK